MDATQKNARHKLNLCFNILLLFNKNNANGSTDIKFESKLNVRKDLMMTELYWALNCSDHEPKE